MTTLSSREFNQDTGRAKAAARRGPVIITDRGRPAHVLLTFEEYERLLGRRGSIVDLLGLQPEAPGSETALSDDLDMALPHPRDPARAADLE